MAARRAAVWGAGAAIACAAVLVAALLPRAGRHAGSERRAGHAGDVRAGVSAASAPARRVYPFSVLPGGAFDTAELKGRLQGDAVAREAYAQASAREGDPALLEHVEARRLPAPVRMFSQLRVGDRLYWSRRQVAIAAGETVFIRRTTGMVVARARCGNPMAAALPPGAKVIDPPPDTPEVPGIPAGTAGKPPEDTTEIGMEERRSPVVGSAQPHSDAEMDVPLPHIRWWGAVSPRAGSEPDLAEYWGPRASVPAPGRGPAGLPAGPPPLAGADPAGGAAPYGPGVGGAAPYGGPGVGGPSSGGALLSSSTALALGAGALAAGAWQLWPSSGAGASPAQEPAAPPVPGGGAGPPTDPNAPPTSPTETPEPGTWVLFGAGLAVWALRSRRRAAAGPADGKESGACSAK